MRAMSLHGGQNRCPRKCFQILLNSLKLIFNGNYTKKKDQYLINSYAIVYLGIGLMRRNNSQNKRDDPFIMLKNKKSFQTIATAHEYCCSLGMYLATFENRAQMQALYAIDNGLKN
jgi:hypothetical protein